MEFPLQITFNLEKVRNESWTEDLNKRWDSLIYLIKNTIDNNHQKDTSDSINHYTSQWNYISSEFNIKEIEFYFSEYRELDLDMLFPDDTSKDTFYVIMDSNGHTVSISLNSGEVESSPGFNRTLYIIRKLEDSSFIIYKKLLDMFFPEEGEFDSSDFIDWDFPTIY